MSDDDDNNKPLPLLQQLGNKRTTLLVRYLNITINKKHNQALITLVTSLRALELLPRNNCTYFGIMVSCIILMII